MRHRHLNVLVASLMAAMACLFLLSSCTLGRIIRYNYPGADDHQIFDNRAVHAGDQASPLLPAPTPPALLADIQIEASDGKLIDVDEFLSLTKNRAFLVLHNDRLIIERYSNGATSASLFNSFSMAKAVTNALLGIAIAEGFISNERQPITDYLTEISSNPELKQVKIVHLAQMTSGIRFSENYGAISDAARLYYSTDLDQWLSGLDVETTPGTAFQYSSLNTQLLGLIIQRATGRTLSELLQEKIWRPMGAEADALWSLDSSAAGMEKAFCCLHARPRDFLRLGRLFLEHGRRGDRQVMPDEWLKRTHAIDESEGGVWDYQLGWWFPWWLGSRDTGALYANGLRGQFMVVYPNKQLVVLLMSDDPNSEDETQKLYLRFLRELLERFPSDAA